MGCWHSQMALDTSAPPRAQIKQVSDHSCRDTFLKRGIQANMQEWMRDFQTIIKRTFNMGLRASTRIIGVVSEPMRCVIGVMDRGGRGRVR